VSSAAPAPVGRDYHLHTRWSDGHGDLDDYVRRALELGFVEIGVSDHLVPAALDDAGYGIGADRLGEYVERARAAAARAEAHGLRVLVGVEVDYAPEHELEMAALLERHAFDYAICSVHFAGGQVVDMPAGRDGETQAQTDALFGAFYGLVARSAAWAAGCCDVIGHVDLPKKFGQRPAADVTAAEDAALAAIAAAGLALEINTAGWRTPAGEAYPSPALLRRARAAGVPLTIGSDAHAPGELGDRFDDAVALARDAGYTALVRLSDHEPVPLP
jgi:histidinol-phosphatase (PHP family)